MKLWRCECRAINSTKRKACRKCGAAIPQPTEAERQVFTNVALPTLLAQRTHLKSELNKKVAEEKALRKQYRELTGEKL